MEIAGGTCLCMRLCFCTIRTQIRAGFHGGRLMASARDTLPDKGVCRTSPVGLSCFQGCTLRLRSSHSKLHISMHFSEGDVQARDVPFHTRWNPGRVLSQSEASKLHRLLVKETYGTIFVPVCHLDSGNTRKHRGYCTVHAASPKGLHWVHDSFPYCFMLHASP